MPIFISYSRKDSALVVVLAANLVRNRHNVWLDKWELSVGDLLIDKIQSALTESSAVILVLSKNSIDSAWCKKRIERDPNARTGREEIDFNSLRY